MPTISIRQLAATPHGTTVHLNGWVTARREHRTRTFFDLANATGRIQCVTDSADVTVPPPESAVRVIGDTSVGPQGQREVSVRSLEVLSPAKTRHALGLRGMDLERVRSFGHDRRHLSVRAPAVAASLRYRAEAGSAIRALLEDDGFVSVDTPVLASVPLYADHTAVAVRIGHKDAFLTQCSGFYLESIACGLERVYNLGPSFRAEEGRSPRHLNEYWHVKAEAAWLRFAEIRALTERFIRNAVLAVAPLVGHYGLDAGGRREPIVLAEQPFGEISYRQALAVVRKTDPSVTFGQSLSHAAERVIGDLFGQPFWIVGNPRVLEPFPYVIDPADEDLTLTADLVVPDGYGEILGIAEKISDLDELNRRMSEKGKDKDPRYAWVRELREHGMPPHSGFGMGFERFLRWTLGLPNVADCIAFPRAIDKKIYP